MKSSVAVPITIQISNNADEENAEVSRQTDSTGSIRRMISDQSVPSASTRLLTTNARNNSLTTPESTNILDNSDSIERSPSPSLFEPQGIVKETWVLLQSFVVDLLFPNLLSSLNLSLFRDEFFPQWKKNVISKSAPRCSSTEIQAFVHLIINFQMNRSHHYRSEMQQLQTSTSSTDIDQSEQFVPEMDQKSPGEFNDECIQREEETHETLFYFQIKLLIE